MGVTIYEAGAAQPRCEAGRRPAEDERVIDSTQLPEEGLSHTVPPGPPYNVLLGCGLGGFVLFTLSFSLRNFNFFHGNINYTTSFCSLFVGPASKSDM